MVQQIAEVEPAASQDSDQAKSTGERQQRNTTDANKRLEQLKEGQEKSNMNLDCIVQDEEGEHHSAHVGQGTTPTSHMPGTEHKPNENEQIRIEGDKASTQTPLANGPSLDKVLQSRSMNQALATPAQKGHQKEDGLEPETTQDTTGAFHSRNHSQQLPQDSRSGHKANTAVDNKEIDPKLDPEQLLLKELSKEVPFSKKVKAFKLE